MKRYFPVLLVTMTACTVAPASPPASPPGAPPEAHVAESPVDDRAARLRAQVAPLAARLARAPFGTGASITVRRGTTEVTVTSGTATAGGQVIGDGTRFNVASVSKVFTAARVMSLSRQGAFDLDEPIAARLPGVRLPDPAGVDRGSDITLRMLVRHRAGLPHQPADIEERVAGGWSDPSLLTRLTDTWTLPLVGVPGAYRYSNLGYALLAAVMERAGGCSFADCMQGYLHELGMTRSTFWPADLDDAAHGHVTRDGRVEAQAPGWYASRWSASFTGLWTTTADLGRFGALLAETSRDPDAPLHAMSSGDAPLGVVRGERLGAPSLEHDGAAPGFYAWLVVVPERDLVVAVAANGGNESRDEILALKDIVAEVVVAAGPSSALEDQPETSAR